MNRCGLLNVAFCITNPELIEPSESKPDKSINWLLNAYSVIAIPAVTYSAARFVEWVVELVLRVVK